MLAAERTIREKMHKIKRKHAIICVAVLIAIAAAGGARYHSQSPYLHLNYNRYINITSQEVPQAEKASVTAEEIKNRIAEEVSAASKDKTRQGIVEEGDTVLITYLGTIDGRPFEGSRQSGRKLTIGSDTIPDFEKAIKGEKTGSTVKTSIDFPADHDYQRLAGRTADYEIYIEAILDNKDAEYTDSFARSQGYNTKQEYEADIKADLLHEKQTEKNQAARDLFWENMLSGIEVKDYPNDLVKEEAHNSLDLYKGYAASHKMSWNGFVEGYLKTNEDELNKMLTRQARETVKEKMAAYKLAKQNRIKVTSREYEKWLEDYLKDSGQTKELIEKDYNMSFGDYETKADLRSQALIEKLQTKLTKGI